MDRQTDRQNCDGYDALKAVTAFARKNHNAVQIATSTKTVYMKISNQDYRVCLPIGSQSLVVSELEKFSQQMKS